MTCLSNIIAGCRAPVKLPPICNVTAMLDAFRRILCVAFRLRPLQGGLRPRELLCRRRRRWAPHRRLREHLLRSLFKFHAVDLDGVVQGWACVWLVSLDRGFLLLHPPSLDGTFRHFQFQNLGKPWSVTALDKTGPLNLGLPNTGRSADPERELHGLLKGSMLRAGQIKDSLLLRLQELGDVGLLGPGSRLRHGGCRCWLPMLLM